MQDTKYYYDLLNDNVLITSSNVSNELVCDTLDLEEYELIEITEEQYIKISTRLSKEYDTID